jgi:hypothetical protein
MREYRMRGSVTHDGSLTCAAPCGCFFKLFIRPFACCDAMSIADYRCARPLALIKQVFGHAWCRACTQYDMLPFREQAMYMAHANRTGWRIVTQTDSFQRDYTTSKFCLVAPGGGWGRRGIVSVLYGCVPVLATDNLYEVGVGG